MTIRKFECIKGKVQPPTNLFGSGTVGISISIDIIVFVYIHIFVCHYLHINSGILKMRALLNIDYIGISSQSQSSCFDFSHRKPVYMFIRIYI